MDSSTSGGDSKPLEFGEKVPVDPGDRKPFEPGEQFPLETEPPLVKTPLLSGICSLKASCPFWAKTTFAFAISIDHAYVFARTGSVLGLVPFWMADSNYRAVSDLTGVLGSYFWSATVAWRRGACTGWFSSGSRSPGLRD